MTLQCAVIDDEPLARECMTSYIAEVDFLELAATGSNPLELSELLARTHVDLIFLDIRMPVMNGVEFLRMPQKLPMVIMTTALPNYALEGYELDVVDYLLKPITFSRFFQSVTKAKKHHTLQNTGSANSDYFFIKVDQKLERIRISDIYYVEALQNYVLFHTSNGRFMTLMSLKSVEENLDPALFVRVHKSFVVAAHKISSIENNEIVVGDFRVPISRNYRDAVLARIVQGKLWRRD